MAGVHPALAEIRVLLTAELTGATVEQVARHPDDDPAQWSAQQVIEHLTTTWRMTTNGVEDRMRKQRPLQTRPSVRQRCAQLVICDCGFFPAGLKAPAATQPAAVQSGVMDGAALAARMAAELEAMDTALNRIEPTAGNAAVLTHMVLGPLNVRRWRRFHRVHARHHLQQLRAALQPSREGSAT